jgi:hypothetical protein
LLGLGHTFHHMSFVYPFNAFQCLIWSRPVFGFSPQESSPHSQGFGESLHEAVNAFAAEREVLNAEAVRLVFRCRWGRRNVSRSYHTHEPLLQKLPDNFSITSRSNVKHQHLSARMRHLSDAQLTSCCWMMFDFPIPLY